MSVAHTAWISALHPGNDVRLLVYNNQALTSIFLTKQSTSHQLRASFIMKWFMMRCPQMLPSNCPQIASRDSKKPCKDSKWTRESKSLTLLQLSCKHSLLRNLQREGKSNPALSACCSRSCLSDSVANTLIAIHTIWINPSRRFATEFATDLHV